MREIKFRGRRIHSDFWAYGDLITVVGGCDIRVRPKKSDLDAYHIPVDPDTVGQFTGLNDCDGKEIYEGDIIQIVTKNPYWAFKKNDAVYWDLDGFSLEGEPLYYWFELHDLKVIGNVHDSPELLEGKDARD